MDKNRVKIIEKLNSILIYIAKIYAIPHF